MTYLSHQIDDFSGGITDQIFFGQKNQSEECDNLLITPDAKLKQRGGSVPFMSSGISKLPTAGRIGALLNFAYDKGLLIQSARSLFYIAPGNTITELKGAAGVNSAFGNNVGATVPMDGTTQISSGYYNGIMVLTHANRPQPIKVYQDNTGTFKLMTAGLPRLAEPENYTTSSVISQACSLAVNLWETMRNHVLDYGASSHHKDLLSDAYTYLTDASPDVGGVPSTPPTDLNSCITFTTFIMHSFDVHESDATHLTPFAHWATEDYSSALNSYLPPTDLPSLINVLNDLLEKINQHIRGLSDHNRLSHGPPYVGSGELSSFSEIPPLTSGVNPTPCIAAALNLAENLHDQISNHVISGDPTSLSAYFHKASDSVSNNLLGATYPLDLKSLLAYVIALKAAYINHLEDAALTTPTYHMAAGTTAEINAQNIANSSIHTLADAVAAMKDLQLKFNLHDQDSSLHRPTAPIGSNNSYSPIPTVGSLGYAFCYHRTYLVNGLQFEDFGPVTFRLVQDTEIPDPSMASRVLISDIPVLSNGTDFNYDLGNLKIRIYRTQNNGQLYRQVGEIASGATGFSDLLSDTLQWPAGAELYTNGGVLSYDPPPPCKFVHVSGNVAYYGNIIDGTDTVPYRLRASLPNQLDSCPADFSDDLEDDITCISSTEGKVVVFSRTTVYRVEGGFDPTGQGSLSHIRISDQTGCIDSGSVQQVQGGIVFAGQGGFYFTDGFKVTKISEHLNTTYKTIISNPNTHFTVAYDRPNNRVWWGVQYNASSLDNDFCLILDLRWGVKGASTFTTASGDGSFIPTALSYFQNQILRGDNTGNFFKHDEAYTTDAKVVSGSVSGVRAVIYDYKSIPYDFGSSLLRKWIPSMTIACENHGDLSLQINSYNDKKLTFKPLTPVRSRIATSGGVIEHRRRMPNGGLRCSFKQIEFTNAYLIIESSDSLGADPLAQATISGTTSKSVILPTGYAWPTDCLDFFLSVETDTLGVYSTDFAITAESPTTLTISDPSLVCPTGTRRWLLKGTPKGEIFSLVYYNVNHVFLSLTQTAFHSGDAGGNAQ